MSAGSTTLAPHALIVGCGYLGQRLAARLLEHEITVFGTTRTPDRLPELSALGVRPLLVSVTQPVTLASIQPALDAAELDVYYLVPPGRSGGEPPPPVVVVDGVTHTVKALRRGHVRRALLVSSSGVYGESQGRPVAPETDPQPRDPRAQVLLEGERLWLEAGEAYHVVRLAGLYGPGRIVGERAVREAAPLVGNPEAFLNLIHVEDAADLLLATMKAPGPANIELGADGQPVRRLDYYRYLADRLGCPAPEVLSDDEAEAQLGISRSRLRRASSKKCDPSTTIARTGWRPRYPDFMAGLEDALNHHND